MKNAWDLFNEMFKLGMEVVIITDEDRLDWGEVTEITNDWIEIKRPALKSRRYQWGEVTLMCQDGFPVRKLAPRSSDLYVEKLLEQPGIKDFHTAIRAALTFTICKCGEIYEEDRLHPCYLECPKCHAKRIEEYRTMRGGHPWEIEKATCTIHNTGNDSVFYWGNHPFEETIVMEDKNGLGGQLWGLSLVFEFM